MTRALVVIRPEPGNAATVAEAAQRGLPVIAAPLFAIEPRAWEPPAADELNGVLIGSANAIRHGGPGLQGFQSKPVYAVGETTAQAAREAGFTVAQAGQGGLQQVLDGLNGEQLILLRLAGEDHVPLTPPPGISLVTRIVYASVAQALPAAVARALQADAVVLLHSAAAARHFAAECDRLGIERAGIALAALGPRIAEAAGAGWRAVEAAPEPTDAALLALAGHMCHSAR